MTPQIHPALADEALHEILLRIEAHRDARGWHADPELWVIYDRTITETDKNFRHLLRRFAVPSKDQLGCRVFTILTVPDISEVKQPQDIRSAADFLRRFASNLAWGIGEDPEMMRSVIKAEGILGWVFADHSYGTDNQELLRRCDTEGLYLGGMTGHPDVFSARSILCVDVHRRKHWVTRKDGSFPVITLDVQDMGGNVPISLNLLWDAAQDTAPPTQAEFDIRYPQNVPW